MNNQANKSKQAKQWTTKLVKVSKPMNSKASQSKQASQRTTNLVKVSKPMHKASKSKLANAQQS